MAYDSSRLTPTQALYVIDRLVRERKIPLTLVHNVARGMNDEIREMERKLAMLRGDGLAAPRSRRRRQGSSVSAETAASRKLQGQYLGLIRHIPASQRGRYKAIVKEKGREAAVRELRAALARK